MSKEIELKFGVSALAPVRKKLQKLGARLLWKGKEENWFFDTKDQRIKKSDGTLRIKVMEGVTLTLKSGSRVERGVKVATEHQTKIENPQEMSLILQRLGFGLTFKYYKRREHWLLKNSYIELDTLRNGDKYVEIEGSHQTIRQLAQKLNLDFTLSTTKSYTKILGY